MAKKPKLSLEGETYAESQSRRKSEAVKETTVKETSEKGWSKKDISPLHEPAKKVKSTAPSSRTQDVKISAEGRKFPDIDGNMIICGETGTFSTAYALMLKKLKVAE